MHFCYLVSLTVLLSIFDAAKSKIILGIAKEPSCPIPKVDNGYVHLAGTKENSTDQLPESVLSGAGIILFCDEGFIPLTNTTKFICQDELVWSNADEIFCTKIDELEDDAIVSNVTALNCTLPVLENGTIAVYTKDGQLLSFAENDTANMSILVDPGTKVHVSCNNSSGNYELINGSNESTCLDDGTWSDQFGICHFVEVSTTTTVTTTIVITEIVTANSTTIETTPNIVLETSTELDNSTYDLLTFDVEDVPSTTGEIATTPPPVVETNSTDSVEVVAYVEDDDRDNIEMNGQIVEIVPNVTAKLPTDSELLFTALANDDLEKVTELLGRYETLVESLNNATETPLIAAARIGAVSIVELLLNKGADVEAKDITGQTAMMLAAKAGVAPIVELLIYANARTEERDSTFGRTPLLWAASLGHVEVVKCLVENDANVMVRSDSDGKDEADGLAIHLAAANGHAEIVDFLLQRNRTALIEARNEKFETALMVAASHGRINVVGRLVDKFGAPIDTRTPYNKTALMKAVSNDHLAVVRFLVQKGANLSAKCIGKRSVLHIAMELQLPRIAKFLAHTEPQLMDEVDVDGSSPLYLAALSGQSEMVSYFLQQGASVAKPGNLGRTSLHAASAAGHVDIVRLLAAKNPGRIWAQSKPEDNGDMAIHLAIRNSHLNVVKLLLSLDDQQIEAQNLHNHTPLQLATLVGDAETACYIAGLNSDKEIRDSTGQTPLIMAAGLGYEEIARCLVDAGANTTAKSSLQDSGNTAVHVAASKGALGVIRYLVNNASRDLLELRDAGGATPLITAVLSGQFEAVKTLVELGADLEATTFLGVKTALWLAASTGNVVITEYLVSKGANTEAVGEYGRTPLLAAAAAGHLEVTQFLVENKANWRAVSGEIDGANTALHLASAFGHFEVSRYLAIAKPELVGMLNKRGHTAGQLASLLWNKNVHLTAVRRSNNNYNRIF